VCVVERGVFGELGVDRDCYLWLGFGFVLVDGV